MKDIEIRWTKGKGPGGQHRNKTENCCVLTHKPTGVTVTVDGRKRSENLRQAHKLLSEALEQRRLDEIAEQRKQRRDEKIKDTTRVRTYDFSRNLVTDHRTGKRASIKNILEKGELDRLK